MGQPAPFLISTKPIMTQIVTVELNDLLNQIETIVKRVAEEHFAAASNQPEEDNDDFIKAKDIQRMFGLALSTIDRHRKNGLFPSFKIGHSRFFRKSEIMEAMQKRYQN